MPLDVTGAAVRVDLRVPRGGRHGEGDAGTNELHVPVDRQLDVQLTRSTSCTRSGSPSGGSSATRPGQDPGGDEVDDTFVVTPDQEGTFSLICTELCGTGHATMRATVVVESQEEFDQWIAEQSKPSAGRGPPAAGRSGRGDGA